MKRILCIISALTVGGAETFLMKIYRTLPPDEYQFDFIVSKEGGYYTEEVTSRGGKIFFVPTRTDHLKEAFKDIRKIVRDNKYECVLKLGGNSLCSIDILAAKLGGAKTLAVRACNAYTNLSFSEKLSHEVFKILLNMLANVKISPSELAADFLFGKHTKVNILNNGVDLNLFKYDVQAKEEIRNEFNLQNKLVVGHIGRLNVQKNHRFLLEVFNCISKEREDAVLLLVGVGELQDEITGWVKDLGLTDKVIFAGQRSDVPKLLSAMDILVFPSLHEGMPNTIIEAQATGLPCIIADTITKQADLTGLVQYLPLSLSPYEWSEIALKAISPVRADTHDDFVKHGYDIDSVAKKFISLLKLDK